jgi:hypothetical protein
MGNESENKMINISERELMEIMADESNEVIKVMSKDGSKSGAFSASIILFMATFSAGILKRIDKKMNEESCEEETTYHYSERGDK